MLSDLKKNLGQRAGALTRVGPAAVLALCAASAPAQEPSPESRARGLVGEVLRKADSAGGESLRGWTRSVVDRALERSRETASRTAGPSGTGGSAARTEEGSDASRPALLAGRHAARTGNSVAGRPKTPEILIFMSLSVPPSSWAQWAREAARAGAPLVLRGVGPEGLRATVKEVGERLGGADAGVAIEPRLFRLFAIELVPAVAAVPGGVPPCSSRGCAADPAPQHDIVTGNIGLAGALEAIAAEGGAGRGAARQMLERLNGEERP